MVAVVEKKKKKSSISKKKLKLKNKLKSRCLKYKVKPSRLSWVPKDDFTFPEKPDKFDSLFGNICEWGTVNHDDLGRDLFTVGSDIVKSGAFVKYFPRFEYTERLCNGKTVGYVKRKDNAYLKFIEVDNYYKMNVNKDEKE